MSPEVPSFSPQKNKEQEMSDPRFRKATPAEKKAVANAFAMMSEPVTVSRQQFRRKPGTDRYEPNGLPTEVSVQEGIQALREARRRYGDINLLDDESK